MYNFKNLENENELVFISSNTIMKTPFWQGKIFSNFGSLKSCFVNFNLELLINYTSVELKLFSTNLTMKIMNQNTINLSTEKTIHKKRIIKYEEQAYRYFTQYKTIFFLCSLQ